MKRLIIREKITGRYQIGIEREEVMETGEKIRYFRERKGMTQLELSEKTEIHVGTIRKYELGLRYPKMEQIKKIASGLEISPIEFLDIEIENEADMIAMLKKISPLFKWEYFKSMLEGEKK